MERLKESEEEDEKERHKEREVENSDRWVGGVTRGQLTYPEHCCARIVDSRPGFTHKVIEAAAWEHAHPFLNNTHTVAGQAYIKQKYKAT
jgi:hypothetical protein